VAHKVADKLGYSGISRDSLLSSSDEFGIDEIRLKSNIQRATQILERFSFGRERYINFISAAILNHLKNDNYVYHGIAGQFFLRSIKNLLKVRIIADLDERVESEAKRQNISMDQARMDLKHDDEERQKWALFLYGIDIVDPGLYDMVLNVSSLGIEEAAGIVADAAQMDCYQLDEESLQKISDLALAAEVRSALFDFPMAVVSASSGKAYISVKSPEEHTVAIKARIEEGIADIAGLDAVEIRIDPYY
jgi:cytidylate kinase